MGGADVKQPLGDLSQRGVPANRFEAAVTAPAQWRGQAIGLILVVIQPMRFLAGVAFGVWMVLVAADLCHSAAFFHNLDSAVDVAEIAHRRTPKWRGLAFNHSCLRFVRGSFYGTVIVTNVLRLS
jgi:hypothetical protein